MLHIILLILKIILFVVLGLLGLALVLIALVLFSPIKYKVDVEYKDNANIFAKVSFLIVSVSIKFSQEQKLLDKSIKILGIKLKLKDKAKNDNTTLEKDGEQDEFFDDYEAYEALEDEEISIGNATRDMAKDIKELVSQVEKEASDSIKESEIENNHKERLYSVQGNVELLEDFDDDDEVGLEQTSSDNKGILKKIKGFKNKFLNLIDKVRKFFDNIKKNILIAINKIDNKVKYYKRKINRFKQFWNMKCTIKTRKYLKKYIPSVFRHILPRKIKGYVHYGFGDPCKTGNVTGYISLLPFVYNKKLSIIPDFYEKIIDVNVELKGKIRIGYLVRIVLNINFWKCLRRAKKI